MYKRKEVKILADKTKTIKNASDKEINDLLTRLRKELDLQSIIRNLKRNSEPRNHYESYEDHERQLAVSTDVPIKDLYHYGVLGMKWGVRRYQPYAKGEKHKGKFLGKKRSKTDISTLSDAELRQRLNRLQMEKQYSQLTRKEISTGKKFVKDVVGTAAKTTAVAYTSKAIVGVVKKAMKK